jgi:hypothetical protein
MQMQMQWQQLQSGGCIGPRTLDPRPYSLDPRPYEYRVLSRERRGRLYLVRYVDEIGKADVLKLPEMRFIGSYRFIV